MNKNFSLKVFEPILIVSDLLTAMFSFWVGMTATGLKISVASDLEALAGLLILGLVTVSFFPLYRLYNYNVLFSKILHFKNLIKAFGWSSLTLLILLLMFNSSSLLEENYFLFIAIISATALTLLFLGRYYNTHFSDFLLAIGVAIFFLGILGIVYPYGIPMFMTKEYSIVLCFIISVCFLLVERYFLVHITFNQWFRRHFRRQVIVVGLDAEGEKITNYILKNNAPYYVVGMVRTDVSGKAPTLPGKKQLGVIEDLPELLEEHQIDDVVITDAAIEKSVLIKILDMANDSGANAWFAPSLMPIIEVKLYIDEFCGFSMILLGAQKNTKLFDKIKFMLDFVVATIICILCSPVLIFIALAVKMDSPGPILYRTTAIGRNGVPFEMFKYRSMRVDSDNGIHKKYVTKLIKGQIEKRSGVEKPLKIVDDPRITKIGAVIRKYSLDELPQLFNVLQGRMTLVGPRPCLPYEYDIYKDWHKKRTKVLPGITGLWQITGRSEVIFDDMILLDLYYIYNRNMFLDFNILFETIFVVLGKEGAY